MPACNLRAEAAADRRAGRCGRCGRVASALAGAGNDRRWPAAAPAARPPLETAARRQAWVSPDAVLVGTKCNRLLLLDAVTGAHRGVPLPPKPAVRVGPELLFNPEGHCGMHAMDTSPDGAYVVTGGAAAEDAVVLRRDTLAPVRTFSVRGRGARAAGPPGRCKRRPGAREREEGQGDGVWPRPRMGSAARAVSHVPVSVAAWLGSVGGQLRAGPAASAPARSSPRRWDGAPTDICIDAAPSGTCTFPPPKRVTLTGCLAWRGSPSPTLSHVS
jgi:hypothetical protein